MTRTAAVRVRTMMTTARTAAGRARTMTTGGSGRPDDDECFNVVVWNFPFAGFIGRKSLGKRLLSRGHVAEQNGQGRQDAQTKQNGHHQKRAPPANVDFKGRKNGRQCQLPDQVGGEQGKH